MSLSLRFEKICLRRRTAAEWTSENPTLLAGEPGYETDTDKMKIGDGTTAWSDLDYSFMRFGASTDYSQFEADGTLVAKGDATVWDDLVNSLIGRRLSSTSGKVDYNWTENTITFQSNGSIDSQNDRVNWNQQLPHAAKVDGLLFPHIHLEQATTNKVIFTLQYRIQTNGAAKTTDWTELAVNTDDDAVFDYPGDTFNQIMAFAGIDMTGAGLSATIQFRLARTDSTAGDIEVTFVDCHVEKDMGGSRTQYAK